MTTTSLLPLILLSVIGLLALAACILLGVLVGRRSPLDSARTPWSDALIPVTASLTALADQVQRTERENVTAQASLRTELTTQLTHHVTADPPCHGPHPVD